MSSEYEQYLKTDFVSGLQPKDFASYDVLGFWKSKENQFPVLSCMAMDILSVQASSVASESAFSTSGRLLTIRRTRLTPESLEMCMCLKDHLDAQERKQNTSPLELPLDVEEGVFNDEVQQNEATQLTDQEIALDASSDGSLSSGERRRDYMMSSGAEDDQTGEGGLNTNDISDIMTIVSRLQICMQGEIFVNSALNDIMDIHNYVLSRMVAFIGGPLWDTHYNNPDTYYLGTQQGFKKHTLYVVLAAVNNNDNTRMLDRSSHPDLDVSSFLALLGRGRTGMESVLFMQGDDFQTAKNHFDKVYSDSFNHRKRKPDDKGHDEGIERYGDRGDRSATQQATTLQFTAKAGEDPNYIRTGPEVD
ncbi:zinc finger BED domain-containing protein RICESLEEPER 2 [Tanacetum coccineum]|uniref:Zinc finger BED domain-containing protein RICESLEEPER 2 n=1 Tax=Tanacetum coccineum TaxID=301880 RepID=A0ABQ5BWW2_9ASTR